LSTVSEDFESIEPPMSKKQMLICPYCGDAQAAGDRCRACGGLFEPLSRQASQNEMGPWFIRSEGRPFQPGLSYEKIVQLIERGQVTKLSIIRGPTTKQFWTVARRIAGLSHLLGYCHNCDAPVDAEDHGCHSCGVPFGAYLDRNYLGLSEVKPMPWDAPADELGSARTGPNRMSGFRPSGAAIGISSFASDDELRRGGLEPMRATPRPSVTLPLGSMEAPNYSAPSPKLTTMADAGTSTAQADAAQRILQRRLAEQKRTIRMLAAVAILLAVLTVVIVAALAMNRKSNDGLPSAAPADQSTGSTLSSAPVSEKTEDVGSVDIATPPTTQAASGPPVDRTAEYRAALELLADARQTDRPAKDRIADYERVVNSLEQLQREADWTLPSDFNETLLAAAREMERLKLEAFFP